MIGNGTKTLVGKAEAESIVRTQQPIENLADRAASYGFPGTVVDGNDVEAVEHFLRFGYVPAPKTIYRDVAKVMPGTWFTVDFDGVESEPTRYFELVFDEVPPWAPAEAVQNG